MHKFMTNLYKGDTMHLVSGGEVMPVKIDTIDVRADGLTKFAGYLMDPPTAYVSSDLVSVRQAVERRYANSVFGRCSHEYVKSKPSLPGIKAVHFSGPVTVVIWEDKTKTIVRCKDGDMIDYEKGFAMAIAKKALGTNPSGSNYYDVFKKYLPMYAEEE